MGDEAERGYANARLYRDMVSMAKVIGAQRNMDIADVFDRFARRALLAEYRKAVRELDDAVQSQEG